MTGVEGRIALVTGAGRGIGRCCAQKFASLGAEVIAVSRTESELTSLVDESVNDDQSGHIQPWVADVLSTELCDRIAGLDQLDGLVNNAGTNRVGPMENLTEEESLSLNIESEDRQCGSQLRRICGFFSK